MKTKAKNVQVQPTGLNRKYVTRSAFQKVCEENKKLKDDLRTIAVGSPEASVLCEMKWAKFFKKEKALNDMIREVITANIKKR